MRSLIMAHAVAGQRGQRHRVRRVAIAHHAPRREDEGREGEEGGEKEEPPHQQERREGKGDLPLHEDEDGRRCHAGDRHHQPHDPERHELADEQRPGVDGECVVDGVESRGAFALHALHAVEDEQQRHEDRHHLHLRGGQLPRREQERRVEGADEGDRVAHQLQHYQRDEEIEPGA
ncbi:MAG: hypothetical protein IPF87_07520 [Gemmatimonadetes bacterium]|nr:hypothetical protein [Gemmatimonadota bacterium]